MSGVTANPVVRALRPQPHRGAQIAAGVVVLATLILMLDVRFAGVWSDGARLLVTAPALALVAAMAVLSPTVGDRPRSFQTVLHVTTCLLALLALTQVARLAGARSATSPGALAWIALAVGLLALAFALGRRSSYCTLVAALAFAVCLAAGVTWIFTPQGVGTLRWTLLVVVLADLLGAVLLRDRQRRDAVMIADAAGIAVLALALTFAGGIVRIGGITVAGAPGWGWMFVVFAAGCGLVAYAGADREAGPGYLGVACLIAFAVLAGGGADPASVIGWPLALALIAGAFLIVGLRPSRPLPPEPPGAGSADDEPVPLHPAGGRDGGADR